MSVLASPTSTESGQRPSYSRDGLLAISSSRRAFPPGVKSRTSPYINTATGSRSISVLRRVDEVTASHATSDRNGVGGSPSFPLSSARMRPLGT